MIKIVSFICLFIALCVLFRVKRKIRHKKAKDLFDKRRREYAASVERAGILIKQMMDASAPLACEINATAKEEDVEKRERPKNIRKVCGYFGGHTEYITKELRSK